MRSYVFVFFIAAVAAYEQRGSVSISGTKVTVSCHGSTILKGNTDVSDAHEVLIHEKAFSSCVDEHNENDINLKFYVQAKVCENCYDLDATLVACAIAADLLFTGGIIILTYSFGRRKSGLPPQQSAATPRRAATPSAPSVPAPDYQPLSDFTRSRDTYATVHKTG